MYDVGLWCCYLKGNIQKLRSCYNRCLKMFFGYIRSYSLTQTLLELNLPSFDTVLVNSRIRFLQRWNSCNNLIVKYLVTLCL